jgi:hypothetical protein
MFIDFPEYVLFLYLLGGCLKKGNNDLCTTLPINEHSAPLALNIIGAMGLEFSS